MQDSMCSLSPYILFKHHMNACKRFSQIQTCVQQKLSTLLSIRIQTIIIIVLHKLVGPSTIRTMTTFGKPYQVWCATLYEGSLNNFLLPVENIIFVLLSAEVVAKEENVLLIVPVIN